MIIHCMKEKSWNKVKIRKPLAKRIWKSLDLSIVPRLNIFGELLQILGMSKSRWF